VRARARHTRTRTDAPVSARANVALRSA